MAGGGKPGFRDRQEFRRTWQRTKGTGLEQELLDHGDMLMLN